MEREKMLPWWQKEDPFRAAPGSPALESCRFIELRFGLGSKIGNGTLNEGVDWTTGASDSISTFVSWRISSLLFWFGRYSSDRFWLVLLSHCLFTIGLLSVKSLFPEESWGVEPFSVLIFLSSLSSRVLSLDTDLWRTTGVFLATSWGEGLETRSIVSEGGNDNAHFLTETWET